jgi:hypothetical protein
MHVADLWRRGAQPLHPLYTCTIARYPEYVARTTCTTSNGAIIHRSTRIDTGSVWKRWWARVAILLETAEGVVPPAVSLIRRRLFRA